MNNYTERIHRLTLMDKIIEWYHEYEKQGGNKNEL